MAPISSRLKADINVYPWLLVKTPTAATESIECKFDPRVPKGRNMGSPKACMLHPCRQVRHIGKSDIWVGIERVAKRHKLAYRHIGTFSYYSMANSQFAYNCLVYLG